MRVLSHDEIKLLSFHKLNAAWLISLIFIFSTLAFGYFANLWSQSIFLLSFWHYYLYWLAYRYGAVPLNDFKRDAMLMKAISLSVLGLLYFSAPLSFVSLIIVAGGFLLNAYAATKLGTDRTYYGYEVADLPPQRITDFPYSWISHPMLIGNITAYGGLLLNSEFRRDWWLLAVAHIAFNVGLLLMELYVRPQRHRALQTQSKMSAALRSQPLSKQFSFYLLGAIILTVLVALFFINDWRSAETITAIGLIAIAGVYAFAKFRRYTELETDFT